jgi:membrane-bound ClpP family serine protease
MKTKVIGIALVIMGLIMTAYTGFNYVTTEKLVEIGPIKINQEINHPVQWTPIIGLIIVTGGIVIIARSSGKKV